MTAPTSSFDAEFALAMDDIETLTHDECWAILLGVQETQSEPLFAFLALHVKLSRVLASPHRREFCALLREWGANAAIDRKIWSCWGGLYLPRYRAGRMPIEALSEFYLRKPNAEHLVGDQTNPERSAAMQKRRTDRAWLKPGVHFEFRQLWRRGSNWEVAEVLNLSDRGSLWYRRIGFKTRLCFNAGELASPDLEIRRASVSETVRN